MQVKYLKEGEKQNTRNCYQTNFPEDTQKFVDYYYKYKTVDNQILVIEMEDKTIGAMLHLNPYRMSVKGNEVLLHYVVAVATNEAYRHQGLMRKLLQQMMKDGYERKEPFTFLMPANQAIYTPFGFVPICDQNTLKHFFNQSHDVTDEVVKGNVGMKVVCKLIEKTQLEDLAVFSQSYLQQTQDIFTKRTTAYYELLWAEQEVQEGGIVGFYEENCLVGYFYYIYEDMLELREFVVLPKWREMAWKQIASFFCFTRSIEPVVVQGFLENSILEAEQKNIRKCPLMMGRLLHLPSFLEQIEVKEGFTLLFSLIDTQIAENNHTFLWTKEAHQSTLEISNEGAEISFTVEEWTAYIFGRITTEILLQGKGQKKKDEIREKLEKIRPFSKIFLNEVV